MEEGAVVKFGGDATGAVEASKKAAEAVKGAVDGMKLSLGAGVGILGGLVASFAALTAVVAGGRLFGNAIETSRNMTTEAASLAKVMGVTTTEASVMVEAFDDVGGTVEGAKAAHTGLMRTLKGSPEKFAELGVAVKDSNGRMRSMVEIQLDVNKRFGEMADSTEKNLAMAQIFGRSWQSVGKVMNLTKEDIEKTRQSVEELGLLVGQESVDAANEYLGAMHDLDDVLNGMQKAIGDAVMPVLTQLAVWLREVGPAAVTVVKGAIGGLVAAFWGLKNGVTIAVAAINGVVFTLAEPILALVEAIQFAIDGKWSDAGARMKSIGGNIANNWRAVGDDMVKSSEDAQQKIMNLFSKPTATKMKTGKDAPTITGKKDNDGKEADGQLAILKATEAAKLALQKEVATEAQKVIKDAHDKELIDTRAYYASKQGMEDAALSEEVASKQRELTQNTAARGKLAADDKAGSDKLLAQRIALNGQLEVLAQRRRNNEADNLRDMQKEEANHAKQVAEQAIASAKQLAAIDIAGRQTTASAALSLGLITATEELAQQTELLAERHKNEVKALTARRALDGISLADRKRLDDELLAVDKEYANDALALQQKLAVEQMKPLDAMESSMSSAFQKTLDSMFDRTTSFTAKMKNLWVGLSTAISQVVTRLGADWAAQQLKDLAFSAYTNAKKLVIERLFGAQSAAIAATTSAAVIGVKTAEAGVHTAVEAEKTGATVAGNLARTAADWFAAGESIAATAWAAVTNIATKAWEAAASVYAAIAAIPYVGPFLAPVMAIAAAGVVGGYAAHIASAEGGYDVPAGVNPVTQLHEKEMVLPKAQANVIRNMASDGGRRGGRGGDVHIHNSITAMDSKDVQRVLMGNQGALASAMKAAIRNGHAT